MEPGSSIPPHSNQPSLRKPGQELRGLSCDLAVRELHLRILNTLTRTELEAAKKIWNQDCGKFQRVMQIHVNNAKP